MTADQPRSLPRAAAVVAALIVSLVLASPVAASSPAPAKSTAKFEVDFLSGMIDHHAMATHMAAVCLDEAVHSELRAMCEQIIADQSGEIEEMQSQLGDWYGVMHAPEMKPNEMRNMERRMGSLSGAEFEIVFMKSMIRHHRRALVEAGRCVDRAFHSELRDMCEEMIEMQSAEIAQLQSWLCEWYDRCRGRSD